MRSIPFVFACVFLPILFCSPVTGQEFTARVVGVSDGDTITVLSNGNDQTKIRLHGIDTPESKQAFGAVAKRTLSQLVYGSHVRVVSVDTDRYGRVVAEIYKGETWINLELVKRGMAWVYLQYSRDPALLAAEEEARTARTGLWRDREPVAPWE